MKLLSFTKGALAMFWLVALLNLFYPFAAPLGGWVNWAALLILLELLPFARFAQAVAAAPAGTVVRRVAPEKSALNPSPSGALRRAG